MSPFVPHPRSPSVDARSVRISLLLPLLSRFRSLQGAEMQVVAELLLTTVRDLERLNEIESLCVQAGESVPSSAVKRILEQP